MMAGDYPIYMEPKIQTLKAVEVGSLSNYQLDSLARREEYSWVFDHGNPPRIERKRSGDRLASAWISSAMPPGKIRIGIN